jgi:hypothetical protein
LIHERKNFQNKLAISNKIDQNQQTIIIQLQASCLNAFLYGNKQELYDVWDENAQKKYTSEKQELRKRTTDFVDEIRIRALIPEMFVIRKLVCK